LLQLKLYKLSEDRRRKIGAASWVTLSNLATLASEDAMTAAALATIGAMSRYSDLSSQAKAVLANQGVLDEASFKKRAKEEEVAVFDVFACAGLSLSGLQLAAVSVSAHAMKANALQAVRRLVEIAASPHRYSILVRVIDGYAASLIELGDQASLDEAQSLFAEAHGVLGRLCASRP
jgi:hypothetical protein